MCVLYHFVKYPAAFLPCTWRMQTYFIFYMCLNKTALGYWFLEFLNHNSCLFIMINNYAANYGDDTNAFGRAGPATNMLGTFKKTAKSNRNKIPTCTFLSKIIPTKPKIIALTFFFCLLFTLAYLIKTCKELQTINKLWCRLVLWLDNYWHGWRLRGHQCHTDRVRTKKLCEFKISNFNSHECLPRFSLPRNKKDINCTFFVVVVVANIKM